LWVPEKYGERFLSELPQIKILAENQPEHIYIIYSISEVTGFGELGAIEYFRKKSYDEKECDYIAFKVYGRNFKTAKKIK
jgi:hypothetical protein